MTKTLDSSCLKQTPIKGTIDSSVLKPKIFDLTKETDHSLRMMAKKEEEMPHKEWSYQHFLMACRVHLELLSREGTIDRLYENAIHLKR